MGNGISTVVATLPPDTERLQRRLQRVTEHRNALWRHWMEAEADEQQERTDHLMTLAKAAQMERQLVELRTGYDARGAELDRMIGAYEAKVAEVERLTGYVRAAEREVRRSGEREIAAGLKCAEAVEEAQRVECEQWRLATGCLTPEHARQLIVSASNAAWPPTVEAPPAPVESGRYLVVERDQVGGRPASFWADREAADGYLDHVEAVPGTFMPDDPTGYPVEAWPFAVVDTRVAPVAARYVATTVAAAPMGSLVAMFGRSGESGVVLGCKRMNEGEDIRFVWTRRSAEHDRCDDPCILDTHTVPPVEVAAEEPIASPDLDF
jgi:hypothetical protein